MKNYFSFNQSAQKLFPVWLLLYLLIASAYAWLIMQIRNMQHGFTPGEFTPHRPPLFIIPIVFMIIGVAFYLQFFIRKFCIEGVGYKEKTLQFSGTLLGYTGTILLGFFLSIITLFIYFPWFMRDLMRFFINDTSYDSENLEFQGKGGELFVIFLVTLLVPLFVLIMLTVFFFGIFSNGLVSQSILQVVKLFLFIPYIYFVYKWYVDVKFKGYIISWKTEGASAMSKIFLEFFLTIITIGIYFPVASVRLYKYFIDRTTAESPESKIQFGFDSDDGGDFVFIWTQSLLTIITLGLYFPWALCKVNSRILGRTFAEAV